MMPLLKRFYHVNFISVQQFKRSMDGDRFFFTHRDQSGSFTKFGRRILIDCTLSGIICDNTGITHVPENAFLLTDPSNFISCDTAPKVDASNIGFLLLPEGNARTYTN